MNEFEKNKKIETLLEETVEQVQPNLMFKAELEEKLRKAHKPRVSFTWNFKGLLPALSSLGVFGALVVFMLWIFQSVELQHGTATGEEFSCPVTLPNGSIPPGMEEDPYSYGNGEIWTTLWPDGKVVMQDDNIEPDGSYAMKWLIYRGVEGALSIEGRRLDADAEPLRSFLSDGYGDHGLQIIALIFPTTGCWEVTARVGEASLTFVTEVVYGEATPMPNENPDLNSTTVTEVPELPEEPQVIQEGGFPWRGTTLYLNAELPPSPVEMSMYQTLVDVPATLEDTRALAQRFGMNGDIYLVTSEVPGFTHYLVVDGNRQMLVFSNRVFHYVLDQSTYVNNPFFVKNENAEAVIAEFMQTYGFGMNYSVEYSDLYGGYYALPQDMNGTSLHLGYAVASGYLFRFSKNGLLGVETSLVGYEEMGTVSIISAEEAWQRVLNSQGGMGTLESMFMTQDAGDILSWSRPRPLNETVTVFGFLSSTGKSVDGNPPLIALDAVPVAGNIADIPENLPNTFVEAIGQFTEENGVRRFVLESWKPYDGYEEGIQGTITREGDLVYITVIEGPKLILPDVPSDLALPADGLFLTGVTRGDVFEWKNMDNRSFRGGGGGGGGNFYKVNLSGTPVPMSTPTPIANVIPSEQIPLDEVIQGLEGLLIVNKIKSANGNIRTEYGLSVRISPEQQFGWFVLKGDMLQELDGYHNRPVKIWAHLDPAGNTSIENGSITLIVDRYEIPYPDLQFEIIRGEQTLTEINGQSIVLFTAEDGITYVQLQPMGDPETSTWNYAKELYIEGYRIPGETYAGYPAIRSFGGGMAGQDGSTTSDITADDPYIYDESLEGASANADILTATIESVKLVYYTPDPRLSTLSGQPAQTQYIQPVWRFMGRYEDGSTFEILVQALTQEFLSPEPENGVPPG